MHIFIRPCSNLRTTTDATEIYVEYALLFIECHPIQLSGCAASTSDAVKWCGGCGTSGEELLAPDIRVIYEDIYR